MAKKDCKERPTPAQTDRDRQVSDRHNRQYTGLPVALVKEGRLPALRPGTALSGSQSRAGCQPGTGSQKQAPYLPAKAVSGAQAPSRGLQKLVIFFSTHSSCFEHIRTLAAPTTAPA